MTDKYNHQDSTNDHSGFYGGNYGGKGDEPLLKQDSHAYSVEGIGASVYAESEQTYTGK